MNKKARGEMKRKIERERREKMEKTDVVARYGG